MITQNNLIDIRNVNIDLQLPVSEKINSFIDQIKNPYHFICDDVEVTLEFNGNESLESKIIKHLNSK